MSKKLAGIVAMLGLLVPLPRSQAQQGEGQPQITFFQHVQWSDDGRYLVGSAMKISRAAWDRERFAALGRGQFDLLIIPVSGEATRVIGDPSSNEMWATWWPREHCLLFNLEGPDRSSSLYFVKADGSDRQGLRGLTGRISQPAVSRDGKKLAFVAAEGNERHIYVVERDGGAPAPRRITSVGSISHHPAWSPDGRRIVFFSKRSPADRDHLSVVNADGSGEKQLTSGASNNVFPSWSPDGRSVIFISDREGSGQEGLFAMNPDGSGVTRLLPGTRVAYARWSPDGRRLGFISGEFPDTHVFVANADGSNRVQLTR